MQIKEKLDNLRAELFKLGVSGYIQPAHDEFMSENPPPCFRRLEFITGFSGSAGTVIILKDKAAFFTDGRYTLQASAEIDTELFTIHNSGEISPATWLANEIKSADDYGKISYDANLFTPSALAKFKHQMIAIANPIDLIWKNRPPAPNGKLYIHEDKFAGESAKSKCSRIAEEIRKKSLDAVFLANPESVCWLLNLRGTDTKYTPLALVRAILYKDGKVDLLVDKNRLPEKFLDYNSFISVNKPYNFHDNLRDNLNNNLRDKKILCDATQTSCALLDYIAKSGAIVINEADPCLLAKAKKNQTQLAGIRAAHIRDGKAVAKLLRWLDEHSDIESVSEITIADKLLEFRRENELFVEPSFPTIAGSGANGAIVHYRATEKTNRNLKKGELLLIDSGGQYQDGTTDITRTIIIGTPSAEHKDRFTRVLKGHIALANAVFPKGTRGSQLDVLARQYLWKEGLDYDHGTGHGVGQFLCVHEGPQNISKRYSDVALEPGMIISNEPGYYKSGNYGIRIENLVVVVEKQNGFLGFETITCAPLDEKLIEYSLLDENEKKWLADYQRWVVDRLSRESGD